MQLYAQHPVLRTRQLAADLGMLAWVVLWVLVARTVHGAVLVLAEPGRAVEDLGNSVAGNMNSAAGVAEDVPVVGDELAAPFDALADASGSVSGAGQAAQDAVGTLATVLAVVLVVLPVGWLLLRWLPWRLGYAREAGAARRLLAGHARPQLLAARALATAPLPRLAALPAGHRRRLAGRRPGRRPGAGRPGAAPARACGCPSRTAPARRDGATVARDRAGAQSASTGRSRGPAARTCAAASRPTTALALRMSPSNTRWTASASGTRSSVMSASSCSTVKPSGRSTSLRSSAR